MVILRCHECKNCIYLDKEVDEMERLLCPTCHRSKMRMFWIDITQVMVDYRSNPDEAKS